MLMERIETLEKGLEAAIAALVAHADKAETWANESRHGGWSTHQVTANRTAADDLRRTAASLRQLLNK